MASKTPKMKFRGGPLDGQTLPKGTGRWPKYVGQDGKWLAVPLAERMQEHGAATFYTLEPRVDFTESGVEIRTYTHASVTL